MYSYDLEKAKKLVDGMMADSSFERIYPFTTENISGYIDFFDLKESSLLTVGSSCDQAINAFLSGCMDVSILDTNDFLKYYYFLKLACINCFTREEFFNYLKYCDHPKVFKTNYNSFNVDMFNRIKGELRILDFKSYMFWDKLYSNYDSHEIRINLFQSDEPRTDELEYYNLYLSNDENYMRVRRILENNIPTFINDNVLSPHTTKTFDNIWLSNITSWLNSYEDIKLSIKNMYNLLNDNGLLQGAYLYRFNLNQGYHSDWQLVYNTKKILEELKEYNPEIKYFLGERGIVNKIAGFNYNYSDSNDAIILCKKR